jgi:hypothetical protein
MAALVPGTEITYSQAQVALTRERRTLVNQMTGVRRQLRVLNRELEEKAERLRQVEHGLEILAERWPA